jgi:hypothetical protein
MLDEQNLVQRHGYLPLADLVTEMELVKHPFRSGVKAQAGNPLASNRFDAGPLNCKTEPGGLPLIPWRSGSFLP